MRPRLECKLVSVTVVWTGVGARVSIGVEWGCPGPAVRAVWSPVWLTVHSPVAGRPCTNSLPCPPPLSSWSRRW